MNTSISYPKKTASRPPKDLVECIEILLEWDNLKEFAENDPSLYHHGVGRFLRNTWKLWDADSDLSRFFHSIGIYHPDDMSGIILTTLRRILNKQPVKLADQVKKHQAYWCSLNLADGFITWE